MYDNTPTIYASTSTRRRPVLRAVFIAEAVLLVAALVWILASCAGHRGTPTGTSAAAAAPTGSGTPATVATTPGGDAGTTGTSGGGTSGGGTSGGGSGTNGTGHSGSGGSNGSGGSGGKATPTPKPTPPAVQPAPEDCIPYNPATLSVQSAGAQGWILTDGAQSMFLFDTQAEAQDGLTVARYYTQSCFIGRGNTRPDRYQYIVDYFKDPSGLPTGAVSNPDCLPYNPATLTVQQDGSLGWLLVSGGEDMLLLDTQAEALRAKLVAAGYSHQCFIGRNNTRPDRYEYIFQYWEQ